VSANGKQAVLDEDEFADLDLNKELSTGALNGLEELKQLFERKIPRFESEDF